MSLASFTAFSVLLKTCQSHMSMQFPYPRDTLNGASYAVWQQNEPMVGVHPTVCHGLDEDTTVRDGNTFNAGEFVEIDIYGSAPHDGGHCAFWWTTDTSGDWNKIIDIKDCTLEDTFYVMMPYTMSSECATKCTFAWTWSPVSSGACEVYMNCAEIKVTGVTGASSSGIVLNVNNDILGSTCQRVDTTTHWTELFSTIKESYTTEDADGGATTADTDSAVTVDVDEEEISDDIQDDTSALCSNPNAPNVDGTIPLSDGDCSTEGTRCDDGQCCSAAGYCGPELDGYDSNGNAQYIDYDTDSTGSTYYSSEDAAFAAYCDNNSGDWRLIDCSELSSTDSGVTRIQSTIALVFAFASLALCVLQD